jgi:hypothetical protein
MRAARSWRMGTSARIRIGNVIPTENRCNRESDFFNPFDSFRKYRIEENSTCMHEVVMKVGKWNRRRMLAYPKHFVSVTKDPTSMQAAEL